MLKVIDISEHQGVIDFKQLKTSKIDGVILREGYGTTTDSKFFEYVKGCLNNGIDIIGVYHFGYPVKAGDGIKEAEFCLKNIQLAKIKPKYVFYDFEYHSVEKALSHGVTLGKNECTNYTVEFCETIAKTEYVPGFYTNKDYWERMYNHDKVKDYVIWLADLNPIPFMDVVFWQYSWKGRLPGINSDVDMDYYYDEKIFADDFPVKDTVVDETPNTSELKATDIINIFKSWMGLKRSNQSHKSIIDIYNGYPVLPLGYKVTYTDDYCDTTVSAAFIKANAVDAIGGIECGVERHIQLFKKHGIWYEDGTIIPEVGDIICYNWDDGVQPNDGWADHIGIVSAVDLKNRTITTIEGNMGSDGHVGSQVVSIGWGYIRGYARPKYSSVVNKPSITVTSSVVKKTVVELAKEVMSGKWGVGDDRIARLKTAGYDYQAVQAEVNRLCKVRKSVDELAKEVLSGKWGNGDDRKTRLKAAGYDWNAVQKKVNELTVPKKSELTIAKEVLAGKWGNNPDRQRKLVAAGWNYERIQKLVNDLI